jgi:hypothetical protein
MMPGERPVRWSRGLRRLLSGQDGQIMPLAGLLLLVMAALVFTVYNTGASVNRRVQTQQAADSSAHSAAVWHARGLNLIAGNNRAAARVASAIIALRAVDRTLDLAAIEIAAEKARTAANLTAAVGSMDPTAIAKAKAEYDQAVKEELILNTMRVPMSKPAIASMVTDKSGTLWATMRSLEYFSGAIAEYAVYAGQVRAMQLGRFNTEGEGICLVAAPTWAAFPTDFLPQGLSDPGATGRLPVVKTTFADFQEPVLNGRPSWPTVGRMGGGRGQGGGGRRGIGSYRAMDQAARAYFTLALPKGTKTRCSSTPGRSRGCRRRTTCCRRSCGRSRPPAAARTCASWASGRLPAGGTWRRSGRIGSSTRCRRTCRRRSPGPGSTTRRAGTCGPKAGRPS